MRGLVGAVVCPISALVFRNLKFLMELCHQASELAELFIFSHSVQCVGGFIKIRIKRPQTGVLCLSGQGQNGSKFDDFSRQNCLVEKNENKKRG